MKNLKNYTQYSKVLENTDTEKNIFDKYNKDWMKDYEFLKKLELKDKSNEKNTIWEYTHSDDNGFDISLVIKKGTNWDINFEFNKNKEEDGITYNNENHLKKTGIDYKELSNCLKKVDNFMNS